MQIQPQLTEQGIRDNNDIELHIDLDSDQYSSRNSAVGTIRIGEYENQNQNSAITEGAIHN